MSLGERIMTVLNSWTEQEIGFSAQELAGKLGCQEEDVRLAAEGLIRSGAIERVPVDGVEYYVSEQAQVEMALIDLVKQGKVIAEPDTDGSIRYRFVHG